MKKEAIVMLCVVVFCAGALVGRATKPAVIKEIPREEILIPHFDFTIMTEEDLAIAAAYYNKAVFNQDEIAGIRRESWRKGYDEGYRKGLTTPHD